MYGDTYASKLMLIKKKKRICPKYALTRAFHCSGRRNPNKLELHERINCFNGEEDINSRLLRIERHSENIESLSKT